MKRFRFFLVGMVLALSVIAVGHAASQRHLDPQTWYLIDSGNPDNANDYRSVSQGFNCGGTQVICSIQANVASGNKPDLSAGTVSGNPGLYSATYHN